MTSLKLERKAISPWHLHIQVKLSKPLIEPIKLQMRAGEHSFYLKSLPSKENEVTGMAQSLPLRESQKPMAPLGEMNLSHSHQPGHGRSHIL